MAQTPGNAEAQATQAAAATANSASAALDPDLAQLRTWSLDMLAAEIQAQRQHMADLSDFLQVLQDDNHVKDPQFAAKVLDLLRAMEQRLQRWETEFGALLKK